MLYPSGTQTLQPRGWGISSISIIPRGRADLDVKPHLPALLSFRSLVHQLFLSKTGQSLGIILKQGWKRAHILEKLPPGSWTSVVQGSVVAWWGSPGSPCPRGLSLVPPWLRQQHHLVPLLSLGKIQGPAPKLPLVAPAASRSHQAGAEVSLHIPPWAGLRVNQTLQLACSPNQSAAEKPSPDMGGVCPVCPQLHSQQLGSTRGRGAGKGLSPRQGSSKSGFESSDLLLQSTARYFRSYQLSLTSFPKQTSAAVLQKIFKAKGGGSTCDLLLQR